MKLSIHQEGDSVLLQWTTDEENGAFFLTSASEGHPKTYDGFLQSLINFNEAADNGTLWHPGSAARRKPTASAGDPLIQHQITEDFA